MFNPGKRSWVTKFRCAFRGLVVGARSQDSFLVHVPAAVLVLVAAVTLQIDLVRSCVLTLCVTIVLAAEYFNSALEWLAKAVDDRHNQHLRNALDIAAAGVLVASAGAALVGMVIFGTRAIELWF